MLLVTVAEAAEVLSVAFTWRTTLVKPVPSRGDVAVLLRPLVARFHAPAELETPLAAEIPQVS